MKYNEELYNLSKIAKYANKQNYNKKEISAKQRRLFKYILEELKRQMTNQKITNEGYIEIIFIDRFYSKSDPGYQEIKDLINSHAFHSFASEYCIYLSEVENRCDEFYSSYYKLVWDYQTYFNSMKKEAVQRTLKQKNNVYKGEN